VALRHSGTVDASIASGGGTLMTLRLPGSAHPPVRV